ncbi:MAG: AraC family transcriptional regulator [Roseiflexaceae bacterium]
MAPDLLTLAFQPRRHSHLSVEASTIADLRQRAAALLGRPQRLLFFCLLVFTAGESQHTVDFQPVVCGPGDVLFITPQQVFQLSLPLACEGYAIIYQADMLPPDDDVEQLLVDETGQANCLYRSDPANQLLLLSDCEALLQTYLHDVSDVLSARILGYQLRIILTRLARLRLPAAATRSEPEGYPSLVRRFRALLEQQYRQSRALSAYARQLYCTPRTLQRAVERVTGQTGKRFIDARVMLEAKRLLAHTSDPVGAIGTLLGFSEPTNFVKYFQRHEGVSPERFRQRYR